jgi:hypothetical protein
MKDERSSEICRLKTIGPDWKETGKQREAWVAELRAGRNPINTKTLEALRIEE